MDKELLMRRIETEEDYIRCPKLGNSLDRFLKKNSDGVEDSVIARLLLLSEEEVEKIYQECVEILRAQMVDPEDEK